MKVDLDTYQAPTHIQITIPQQKRERDFGVYSTKHPDAKRVSVRFDPKEIEIAERAARILEIPLSTMVRDVAMSAANAIVETYDAYLKSRGSG